MSTKGRRFYAFGYYDAKFTTSGGDHGTPLHIAGMLYHFGSRRERDEWVSEGCYGKVREVVTVRDLPMGWRTRDAEDHDTFRRW